MTEQEMVELADAELWCQTFTGRKVHTCAITADDIDIEDIAHALSMQCRFGGHCNRFYSVATHSLYVEQIVSDRYRCEHLALEALLHDASEAYLVDVPRPVKCSSMLAGYRALEQRVQAAIAEHFGLSTADEHHTWVRMADELMLATEANELMTPFAASWNLRFAPLPLKIRSESPDEAKQRFLARFHRLLSTRGSR